VALPEQPGLNLFPVVRRQFFLDSRMAAGVIFNCADLIVSLRALDKFC
jgi:hypothetical protein